MSGRTVKQVGSDGFLLRLGWALLLLTPTLLLNARVYALTTDWIVNPDHPDAKVRLLLSGEVNTDTREVSAALEVKLDGGWKTYWRSPGDAGIAPEVDWQLNASDGSVNIRRVDWLWPVPERIEMLGLTSWGYRDHVTFPLKVEVLQLDQPTVINAHLRLSSCTTVCVLTDYNLRLDFIPTELEPDVKAAFQIDRGLSSVPSDLENSDIRIDSVKWSAEASQLVVEASREDGWTDHVGVIVDGLDDVTFCPIQLQVEQNKMQAVMTASSWLGEVDLAGQRVNLTLIDGDSAYENSLPVTAVNEPVNTSHDRSVWFYLLLALVGGLILNLMPCVLPVLGMKLSSVVSASGQSRTRIRQQFLSSAAGILCSFWLLALFLWLLKWTGNGVGWGIQFQNPWFVVVMVTVTALFAANLAGAFEIRLPSTLNSLVASVGDESRLGHFLQGMFATLLATPCSAPFLGTAVAFALTTSDRNLFAVFTALGLGLASPWLLIAARPSLLSWLPKPGNWMNTLRNVLALLLLGTSLWLLTLLERYLSVWTFPLLALLPAVPVVSQLLGQLRPGIATVKKVLLALPLSLALVFAVGSVGLLSSGRVDESKLRWTPLNESQIARWVDEGKTVFVDVTADWCITCKANKLGVLDRHPTYLLLQADHIRLMRGDWTQPSDKINAYLQKNGRFGVPFNVVYGPKAPEGIPLPVVLTHKIVDDAVAEASGYRQ